MLSDPIILLTVSETHLSASVHIISGNPRQTILNIFLGYDLMCWYYELRPLPIIDGWLNITLGVQMIHLQNMKNILKYFKFPEVHLQNTKNM